MSPVCATAIRLFEGELFFLTLIIEWTDRCVVVRPVKHHAANDFDARAQSNRVCWKPARRMHSAENIFSAADKPYVERISWNAAAGARHHIVGTWTCRGVLNVPKEPELTLLSTYVSEPVSPLLYSGADPASR